MPIHYSVNDDLKIRLVRYSGKISADDISGFARGMRGLSAQMLSYAGILLFDEGVDLSIIGANELMELSDALGEAADREKQSGIQRVAAVSNHSTVRHELRMWREIATNEPSFTYQLNVFDSMEEAAEWLGIDSEAADAISSGKGFRAI